jgi:TIGR03009 family protein
MWRGAAVMVVGLVVPLFRAETVRAQSSQSSLPALLQGWEQRTQAMKSLRCEFRRRIKQQAYPEEHTELGRAVYVRPNRGRMDLWRLEKDAQGNLKPVRTEIYICEGNIIHQYLFETKEYIRHVLPNEKDGENSARTALPFLFGMTASEATRRFELKIFQENETYAWIEAIPRWESDRQNFSKVKLVLNKRTFLPEAVLVIEPVGDQYLYEITKIEVNPTPPIQPQELQPLQPPRDWQLYVNRLDQPTSSVPPR